jgi:hypothetical protein
MRGGVFYNIHIGFGIPIKLVRIIKIILNETCSKSVQVNICLIHFLF